MIVIAEQQVAKSKAPPATDSPMRKMFLALTGYLPFPWQEALYQRIAAGDFPTSCCIPTGLGKTAIVALWLTALVLKKNQPRRLVYVVDRRTVVDQTTEEVENIRRNLSAAGITIPLGVSTLRGQFADNHEWSADPSKPAVVCGTVDVIGSALLFNSYRAGYRTRPLHAGFLGQDTLIIHDEAHLEPAFHNLLGEIQSEQKRSHDLYPLRVIELSATSRGKQDFTITQADREHPIIKQRIQATKQLILHSITDEKKQLAQELLKHALAHRNSKKAILIFARTVETVDQLTNALRKQKLPVQQLTGVMRGFERDKLCHFNTAEGCPIFARFLQPSHSKSEVQPVTPTPGTVYLVCTSAGEVGVNISADHMVCDLTTFDSMVQRLGRVNRFGTQSPARVDVVHPDTFDPKPKPKAIAKKPKKKPKKTAAKNPLGTSRKRTLVLLQQLNGDGSSFALEKLNLAECLAAFSPTPQCRPISDIVLDQWALTTTRNRLPGRPLVAEFLHGIREWEPHQTQIAWRSEVSKLRVANFASAKTLEELANQLLDDYPLKPHEILQDRTDRIFRVLATLAHVEKTPVWLVADDNEVEITTFGDLLAVQPKERIKYLKNRTILLPPEAGGLKEGRLASSARYDCTRIDYDVADEWHDKLGQVRLRKLNDSKPVGMKLVGRVSLDSATSVEPKRFWYWFVRILGASAANARSHRREYDLATHNSDARRIAKGMVERLDLDPEIALAVIIAAGFHDLGKDRWIWQWGIGNSNYPTKKWAKSGHTRAISHGSRYRHEFGSVLDVTAQLEFQQLSPDMQELALHLMAAHHGRARPHFPAEEAFDHDPRGRDVLAAAAATPIRFAKLQHKFGRWGLAYLESLVRAVDILASQLVEGGVP